MAWLEANRGMVITDYHAAFVEAFGRSDVSAANLHGLRKRLGWKVGRARGRFVGRHTKFSKAEIAWLKDNATLPIGEYHAAFCQTFGRTDMTAPNLNGLRKRQGWRTGRTGRFEKGSISHNKGKPCPPGVGGRHENARKSQFKKGEAPHNTKWLGHERVGTHGYVEISVAETNPHTGYERRYVLKHIRLWEAENGPVPDGHCLKCLDGDRLNTNPSNWEAIPRGVLPRLNGGRGTKLPAYDQAAPELRPTIMAIAKAGHLARRRARKDQAA